MLQFETRYAPTFGEKSSLDIAQRNPFAMVMSFGTAEPACSHIPMVVEGSERIERLRGHVGRNNIHAGSLVDGSAMLAVFTGPECYISPSWYEFPRDRAPTWNYAVVHAWGSIRLSTESDLIRTLNDLATWGEAGSDTPWLLDNYNPEIRNRLLRRIIGFELRVERIEARFKLNQHNTDNDRRRVISSLIERGDKDSVGIARLMQETLDRDTGSN